MLAARPVTPRTTSVRSSIIAPPRHMREREPGPGLMTAVRALVHVRTGILRLEMAVLARTLDTLADRTQHLDAGLRLR